MIKTTKIIRVRREYPGSSIPCRNGHGGIAHVGGHCQPAELPGGPGLTVVKSEHLAKGRTEKSGEPCLATPISPSLGYYPGRNDDRIVMFEGPDDDGHDSPIVPLESDQCPRVQEDCRHRPSAWSAAFRSDAFSGPPVSASISSSIDAKSSSFACSSSARETYA